jgi:hypothetical protein
MFDLPPPAGKFSRLQKSVLSAVEIVADAWRKRLVAKAVQDNEGDNEICAAFNGTCVDSFWFMRF